MRLREERILWIENDLSELCDKLLKQASAVDALLGHIVHVHELNPQSVFDVRAKPVEFFKGVLEQVFAADLEAVTVHNAEHIVLSGLFLHADPAPKVHSTDLERDSLLDVF